MIIFQLLKARPFGSTYVSLSDSSLSNPEEHLSGVQSRAGQTCAGGCVAVPVAAVLVRGEPIPPE